MSEGTIHEEKGYDIYDVRTKSPGPAGALPLTGDMLINRPSGDIFGMTLNAGMGWDPAKLLGREVFILATTGGLRDAEGKPIALGMHTGHYEIGDQVKAAAQAVSETGGVPYAAYVSDPCDGRSQGTTGMFDSLPYRNDSAIVMRRLIRSLPTRKAVVGIATCDKGLPAMMMALASMHDIATVLVPGGATLPATKGDDAGNLLLHLPAIAHAAGCRMPSVQDWTEINRRVPRLVSVLPNGPVPHPTVRAFLAGGVPEVMLHLRALGLLHEDALTVTGETVKENLDRWEKSERRERFKAILLEQDGIRPEDVIMSPAQAAERGLTSTITFPVGNIAPEGSVIKSTAIDPSVVGADGVYRHTGKVKVFTSERDGIRTIKSGGIHAGDIMVVMGGGPSGTGMEETYQLTSSLKHLSYGKHVSLLTDARFSGVSTGACVGHIGPEALAGGPIAKLRDGDIVEMIVDTIKLEGSLNFIGTEDKPLTPAEGAKVLAEREGHPDLKPAPALPDDTRLWAALQAASGGTWGGCVYDTDKILKVLAAGQAALKAEEAGR